nr:glycosyl hydrolase family 28-related protein [uncultured Sphingomonas sp.]
MSVVESYSTLSAFKAGPAVGAACVVGANDIPDGAFFFTSGDFSGQPADDQDIVKADDTPLSAGAWVRQTSSSVTFLQTGTDALRRPASAKLHEVPLSPADFGAVGDGSADDTEALQRMLNAAQSSRRPIVMPPGKYRITDSLILRDEVRWTGSEVTENGTVILNDIEDPAKAAINIYVGRNESVIGMEIGHMLISSPESPAGGWVRRGVGIYLETDYLGAVQRSWFHHLIVYNHTTGFHVGGRIYMCVFEALMISANTLSPEIPVAGPSMGFRTGSFADITYNSFRNIEVTNVQNGGKSFEISSHYSDFTQITMDGPAYFNGPGCTARNITCETMTQTANFPQTAVMNFTNFARLDSIVIRDVPTAKFPIGIFIGGSGVDVSGIRFYHPEGGGQPDTPIWLDGSGTIRSCRMVDSPAVNRMNLAALGGYIAIDMDDFTDYSISGSGAVRTAVSKVGFFGATPVVKPTGVPADVTAIHTALVSLGLVAP